LTLGYPLRKKYLALVQSAGTVWAMISPFRKGACP
jgi:hypothetical protein